MRRPRDHDRSGGDDSGPMDSGQIDRTWFDERVEPYLDGELPEVERRRFSERLRHDTGLRAQVAFAEQISLTLAASGAVKCSDDLAARLESIPRITAAADDREPSRYREGTPLRLVAVSDPRRLRLLAENVTVRSVAVAASLVAVLAFAAMLLMRAPVQPAVSGDEAAYSEAEVEQALRDVRYALAWVSEAGRQAGTSVIEPVIERNVVGPANRATNVVFGPGVPDAENLNEPSGELQ